MPTLLFRNVTIRYFDCRRSEADLFVRIHLSADLTDIVCERMEWNTIPDSIESCKLSGQLAGESFVLTPNDRPLASHEMQLACGEVGDFQVARISEGDAVKTELRFVIRTAAIDAAAKLVGFWKPIGRADSKLKLSYSEQAELEMEGGGEEEEAPEAEVEPAEKPKRKRGGSVAAAAAAEAGDLEERERARIAIEGRLR
jgi:hypothetical protein